MKFLSEWSCEKLWGNILIIIEYPKPVFYPLYLNENHLLIDGFY